MPPAFLWRHSIDGLAYVGGSGGPWGPNRPGELLPGSFLAARNAPFLNPRPLGAAMERLFPLTALWLLLPAYVANMSPVLLARMLPTLSAPIDGGRRAADGERLLGDGKTWRGLIGGTLLGGITGVLASAVWIRWHPPFGDTFDAASGPFTPLLLGLGLGFGALAGDSVKSYFKRRTGRGRGASWPGFDQLDFVAGALLVGALAAWAAGSWAWYESSFLRPEILLVLVLATPVLHLLVNVAGYWLKLKKEPW